MKKQLRDRRNRQRHAARSASGTCTRCGRLPPEPGLKMCAGCAGKRRAAEKARRDRARAQGKLYRGRDPERCRRADRAGDKRRRRARRAGLCTAAAAAGRRPRSVCEPCRDARRAIDRRGILSGWRRTCVRCTRHGRRPVPFGAEPRAGEGARSPSGEPPSAGTIRKTARERRMCRLQSAFPWRRPLSPLRMSFELPRARA